MKKKASVKTEVVNGEILSSRISYAINTGDVKLEASKTKSQVGNGPITDTLALTFEKPGIFTIHYEYDVYRKGVFQLMNSIKVMDKPLRLTCHHECGNNRTILDGALEFDSANMVSANYMHGSGNCKFKYTYVHGGSRTFEQCYDTSKYSWDFMVSQRVMEDCVVRASYQTSSRVLGLELGVRYPWGWGGARLGHKIRASIGLPNEQDKLSVETTLDFEM